MTNSPSITHSVLLSIFQYNGIELREEPVEGIPALVMNGDATICSAAWSGSKIRRIRLCELEVIGKFSAETLVVYPYFEYDFPIFGCEYLSIGGKKFFGAMDFHPISKYKDYATKYLSHVPNRESDQSKFYDLSEYFSSKFWMRKEETDFYDLYERTMREYLSAYAKCVLEAPWLPDFENSVAAQREYDRHMAEKDPAHGILKSYFSSSFADKYIHKFLFSLSK